MNGMLLAVTLALNGVKVLEIDHVPNNISYRTALGPGELASRARVRVESRDPRAITTIVSAIQKTGTRPDVATADLRYAIRLRNARGATVATIYLDAFGLRGVVDGQPVRYADDAIKRAVVSAFPALYR
ncbi:MAG TPA: hypothetical protein VF741_02240 [Candidatus Aquilonibacter sp.]